MLHWHPWWLHTTDSSSRVPTDPVLLHEPAQWSAEQWLDSQARIWDRCLESNRAWWKTCAAALPAVTWPQPPVVVPPPPEDASDGEANEAQTPLDAGNAEALRKRLRAARWRHHEASGAAQARIERQRKR